MEANVLTTGLLAKTKPEVIDSLNNGQGTFLYNHNIKEVKVIAVVSYLKTTSNHNRERFRDAAGKVVSYLKTTSNHNPL